MRTSSFRRSSRGGSLVATLASILLSGAAPLAASDAALASWRAGTGSVDGAAAHAGLAVAAGQAVASGAEQPARIELAAPASGALSLAPGTSLTLAIEEHGAERELVIALDRGAVQVDLADKAGFTDVEIRSGGMAVRIVGTLLLVERGPNDESYAALVHGRISIGSLAAARAVRQWLNLNARQTSTWIGAGFGPILTMAMRPQFDLGPGRGRLSDRASGASVAETREFTRGLRGAAFAGKTGESTDLAERGWHRDDLTARIVVLAAAEDPKAGAALAADVANADPIVGGQAVAAVIISDPGNASQFIKAVVAAAPSAASEIVGQAVFASPDHAVDIVSAAISASPSQLTDIVASAVANQPDLAVDITMAALTASPDHAADIVAAAITANPSAAEAITAIAISFYPESAAAITAAAERARSAAAKAPHATAGAGAAVSGGNLTQLLDDLETLRKAGVVQPQDASAGTTPVSPE